MNKFIIGDEVIIISTRIPGIVTNGFYWRDAEGKPPTRDMIPIDYYNGDRAYVDPNDLDYDCEVDRKQG